MTRFYKTPYLVKKAYPYLHWNTNVGDTVHLTFDDGPDLTVTPWVLDQLDRVGAKATFFCIGKKVIEHRDLIRGMMETGHRIANHTHDHLKGTQTSASAYVANVAKCAKELERLGSQNKLFRPPYGKIKRSQIQRLKGMKQEVNQIIEIINSIESLLLRVLKVIFYTTSCYTSISRFVHG